MQRGIRAVALTIKISWSGSFLFDNVGQSTFYQNASSATEQAAIRTTTVVNEDNPEYG